MKEIRRAFLRTSDEQLSKETGNLCIQRILKFYSFLQVSFDPLGIKYNFLIICSQTVGFSIILEQFIDEIFLISQKHLHFQQ